LTAHINRIQTRGLKAAPTTQFHGQFYFFVLGKWVMNCEIENSCESSDGLVNWVKWLTVHLCCSS